MKKIGSIIFFCFWIFTAAAAASEASKIKTRERVVMGWIEPVVLVPWGIDAKAKLDSGAKTSSLHAKKIERFEKEGEEWVRFVVEVKTRKKKLEQVTVERPLVRDVRIKRHRSAAYERPVVKMKLCLDGKDYETQFNLVDRTDFNYPVLLGRRFLKEVALIDPKETFLTAPGAKTCQEKHPPTYASDDKSAALRAELVSKWPIN